MIKAARLLVLAAILPASTALAQARPAEKKKAGAPAVVVKPAAPIVVVRPAEAKSDGDRYGPKVDWSTVPAWRQTSFFGLRAKGKTFVFVVDCSGSMDSTRRLDRAKRELRRAVSAMAFPQKFLVIFYNERPHFMPGGVPQTPGADVSAPFYQWLARVEAEGGTDPRSAMSQALALAPDAVFLLSDGEFPDGTAAAIAGSNPKKVPIHCVDLAGGKGAADLRKIAAESGGEYALRP